MEVWGRCVETREGDVWAYFIICSVLESITTR